MRNKGFIQIIPIIIIAIIAAILFIAINNKILPLKLELFPTPTPTPTTTPTATPTLTPSPTPTQTPIATPTIKPSVKPTSIPVSGPPGAGYSAITVHTEKGDFQVGVLSIDLASSRMITDTASDSDCSNNCPTIPLRDFVTRNAGFAGVNGTYFCPAEYPDCSGKTNSFDFPVYNTRLGKWINQGNLSWNSRSMVYFDGSGAHYLQNANSFGGGLTAGIVNYPGLVNSGNVQIDDNQSGLTDKQKAVGLKVGIGLRGARNVMIAVAQNVNMQQFAYVFKSLGADGALNLDTGGSTALFYNGSYLAGPGRNIPNAIIFAR